jgi:SecD/SecF fusion protein
MRPFYWKIALCLGLVLVSGVVTALAYYQYDRGEGGFKLGVDLVGGTILVYEVDQDKFSDEKAKHDFEQRSQQLAASLKKRIDPTDLYNVTVRQVGTWRVEIILPTGGKHQADVEERNWQKLLGEVRQQYDLPEDADLSVSRGQIVRLVARVHDLLQEQKKDVSADDIGKFVEQHYKERSLTNEEIQAVKEKIAQVGSLEFRILANEKDDKRALELARAFFVRAQKDGPERKSLQDANVLGKAPPPPREPDGRAFLDTATGLGSFTYSYAEMGKSERKTMHLDNESEGTPYVMPDGRIQFLITDSGLFQLTPEGQIKPVTLTSEEEKRYDPATWPNTRARSLLWHQAAVARGEETLVRQASEDKVGPYWIFEKVYKSGEKFDPLNVKQFEPMPLPGSALMYSRRVANKSRLPKGDENKGVEYFLLTRDPEKGKEVTGLYLQSAYVTQDRKLRPAVGFRFNQAGGDRFYDLTSKNAPDASGFHRQLAILLDGLIVSAPSLNAKISTEGIIEGNFTTTEVQRLVDILNSGALPASLKPQPVSENTMGATLGEDTISKGTFSVGLAFAAVLLFMVIYYRFAGVVACIALLANLLLTVAFMVLVQATFTLPGLAGLVLMLGMAVDANVLIYERIREERDRGATLALAIRNGYDRAFPTIIDTHLSSIFTAIVLYAVGNDQLKGFGISLTVGLIISLFTSLFMTRLMFDISLAKGWLTKLTMLRFLTRTSIDFMAIRYYFFAATIALTVLGASIFFYRLDKGALNIDFMGGTAYSGQLTKPVDIGDLRFAFDEANQKDKLKVAEGGVKQLDEAGRSFEITYEGESKPRRIDLPNQATVEEVRKRAQQLPDASVEQIFISTDNKNVVDGYESALFTVRTGEKAPELVQAAITRLLAEVKRKQHPDQPSHLKKIGMKIEPGDNPYRIGKDNRDATLEFIDLETKEPDFASPAQVRLLLDRELKALELGGASAQFTLEGEGPQDNGRFKTMKLTLTEPLSRDQLTKVLQLVEQQFEDRPQPERLENFDSQLAQETQQRALYAILASWGAILLYLWFRFGNWTFGLAAVLCLIHDLFFTLGMIAFCHFLHGTPIASWLLLEDFKIDLPAVAALLTLVGYSVNDTIVVFDRIREVRGKNPELTPKMINDSVNQTLSRTLLTALTVFLVVIVLYIFGGEGVHLFAFVMVIGVLVGTYSSIYIASPLLLIFGEGAQRSPVREREPVSRAV